MGHLYLALGLWSLRVFGFFTEPLLSSGEIHRVVGEPARVVRPARDPADLKIVTWNIERGTAYDSILEVSERWMPMSCCSRK